MRKTNDYQNIILKMIAEFYYKMIKVCFKNIEYTTSSADKSKLGLLWIITKKQKKTSKHTNKQKQINKTNKNKYKNKASFVPFNIKCHLP